MHPARPLIGRLLAAALLAAHLALVVLAASPTLHHWLHGDAGESDHHCAVTAMIAGLMDCSDAPAILVTQPPITRDALPDLEPEDDCLASGHATPGERAPPAC